MKQFIKVSVISIIATFPTFSMAAPASKIIDISDSAIVAPLDLAEVDYSDLHKETAYDIKCNLTSDDKSLKPSTKIKIFVGSANCKYYINGKQLNDSLQGKVNSARMNTIYISGVHRTDVNNNTLVVSNLDDTDTLTVDGCRARPTAKQK